MKSGTRQVSARRFLPVGVVCAIILGSVWLLVSEHRWRNDHEGIGLFDLEAERERIQTEFQSIEQMLAPAQFEVRNRVRDQSLRQGCGMAYERFPFGFPWLNGDVGEQYMFYLREYPGPVLDPAGKADLIADHWDSQGYTVYAKMPEHPFGQYFTVHAKTDQQGWLTFRAHEDSMGLSARTGCARTDVDLNEFEVVPETGTATDSRTDHT
jgi:hypothetical protein